MNWSRRLLVIGGAVAVMGASTADPSARLADPAQEARARSLFRQVRCLVCQNESIDDSEAPLASDLRQIVRQQVAQGRSDSQVKAFLTDRYGEFVLFNPRFSAANAILWLTPFAIVGVGAVLLIGFRRRKVDLDPPLSADEKERLEGLSLTGLSATVPPQAGPRNAPDE